MIDRDRALAIQQRAMRDFVRMLGSSAPGSSVYDGDRFAAATVPACAQRSITNSVAFSDASSLLDQLEPLAARYDEAGIAAWTVWVPDFDRETISALEAAGHAFDGKPQAMVLELESWEAPPIGDLDWDAEGSGEVAGPLNDLAYGIPPGDGIAAGVISPPPYVSQYQARVDDDVACVLGTVDHDDDIGIYFVATHPDHRGEGLATRLMAAALADAQERGLRTSSLQSSAIGEPIYEALGYLPHFRLHMYERRNTA